MTTTAAEKTEKKETLATVRTVLDQHGRSPARMVPILQDLQKKYRYLPESVLKTVADELNISAARVFGVATFYSQFTLEPRGKYVLQICDGTACHVKGSMEIYNALVDHLDIEDGAETSDDMMFTVETVSCLGACGLAPAITVNGDVRGELTPDDAVQIVEELYAEEENENNE